MAKKLPTAVVVIPTYNEAESIGEMIDVLCGKIFPGIKTHNCQLLVVDDTSPDGTWKIVEQKAKRYKNLHLLLNKTKAGIGAAYVKGFRHAMSKLGADVVIEFDGDFQHPPATVPKLLEKIDAGYDYVLGSRNIKGGSIPKSWGFRRMFFSKVGGGLVARFILFFPGKNFFKITDPTTGLKASRVKGFVERLPLDNLISKSFGYKLEFLYRMTKLNAKVAEIPLKFGLREKGESKITSQTAKEIFLTIIKLRLSDPATKKFLKFAIVGFIGFVVNAVTLELFRASELTAQLASYFEGVNGNPVIALFTSQSGWSGALAAEMAIISNFILNNFWTFAEDKITTPFKFFWKFLQFNLTSFGAVIIQFVVIGLATAVFGDTALVRQLALVGSIAFLIIPYNWLMYNLVIWKK
jgi:dolichol-phosphate mannosyltransferase